MAQAYGLPEAVGMNVATHPPIGRRVALLEGMAGVVGGAPAGDLTLRA